jgi:hypothetical protein
MIAPQLGAMGVYAFGVLALAAIRLRKEAA